VTTFPHPVLDSLTLAGQVITHGVPPVIVTVKLQVVSLPAGSVALQ